MRLGQPRRCRLVGTALAAVVPVIRAELRVVVVVAVVLVVAALAWSPLKDAVDLALLTAWMAPHQDAWYAMPLVAAAFTLLGFVLFPVLVMIAATGVVFGPWLGPLYAMVGCLASGSAGFAIGRWAGVRRVEAVAGPRAIRITRALERNGTLAVFLARKVPAPFTLTNIAIGASRVRYRDFILGTILGMGAIVVALAGFGYQLKEALRDPSLRTVLQASAILAVPLGLAWLINRALRRDEPDA